MAQKTIEQFVTRATQLYEHERKTPESASLLGDYVSRLVRWTRAGVWLIEPIGEPSVGRLPAAARPVAA